MADSTQTQIHIPPLVSWLTPLALLLGGVAYIVLGHPDPKTMDSVSTVVGAGVITFGGAHAVQVWSAGRALLAKIAPAVEQFAQLVGPPPPATAPPIVVNVDHQALADALERAFSTAFAASPTIQSDAAPAVPPEPITVTELPRRSPPPLPVTMTLAPEDLAQAIARVRSAGGVVTMPAGAGA